MRSGVEAMTAGDRLVLHSRDAFATDSPPDLQEMVSGSRRLAVGAKVLHVDLYVEEALGKIRQFPGSQPDEVEFPSNAERYGDSDLSLHESLDVQQVMLRFDQMIEDAGFEIANTPTAEKAREELQRHIQRLDR